MKRFSGIAKLHYSFWSKKKYPSIRVIMHAVCNPAVNTPNIEIQMVPWKLFQRKKVISLIAEMAPTTRGLKRYYNNNLKREAMAKESENNEKVNCEISTDEEDNDDEPIHLKLHDKNVSASYKRHIH